MKKIIKYIVITLIMMLDLFTINKVNAAAYNGRLYELYHPDSGFTVFAAESMGYMDYNSWMIKSTKDSKIYYCIDPAIPLEGAEVGSHNYIDNTNEILSSGVFTKEKYDKVRLIAYYGYHYKDSKHDHTAKKWYGITQVMIWRVMRPDLTWTFKENREATPNKNLYKNEVAEINELVKNHNKVASFAGQKLKLLKGEKITLTDKNEIIKDFLLVNSPKYVTLKENSNSITITANEYGTETLNYSKRQTTNQTFALLKSNSYQNIIEMGSPNDLANFQISVEVTGGVLTLQKIDSETEKAKPKGEATLKGAIYEIYDLNGIKKGEITTDENGKGSISLDYGKYILKEKQAPNGYNKNSKEYPFEITKENNEITIEVPDKVITGKVVIKKETGGSGEEYKLEKDAVFEITGKNDKIVEKITTNENGIAVAVLPYGTYKITQVKGKQGYNFIKPETITINEDKVYELNLKNLKNSKLLFSKTDFSTKKPIPNTLIEIYNEKDELIYSGRTDEKGQIEVENLEIGKYYILEKDAPKYYLLNKEKMWFEVEENGKIIKANMENKRKEGSLEIKKIDKTTENPLKDAEFEIIFEETGKVYKEKTDKKGLVKLNNLIAGKYCIKEVKAPKGYQLEDGKNCFEIDEENEVIKVKIKNEKLPKLPDTNDNSISIIIAISSIFILTGFIYIIYEKSKNKK